MISGRVNAFQTILGPLEAEIDENRLMFYILYKSFKSGNYLSEFMR